jgi:hypothetical protein
VTRPAWLTMIDAKPVRFPARCPRVSTAALYFEASSEPLHRWVPPDLELIEDAPGRTEAVVALASYVGGDWGTYDALDVVLRARPAGCTDPAWTGLFFLDTVVNERFTTELSYWVLGIGHRFGTIDVSVDDERVAFDVGEDDRHLLSVTLPPAPTSVPPEPRSARVYAHVGGILHAIPIEIDMPDRSTDVADVDVRLGDGRLRQVLADIGLPRRPDSYAWSEHLTCTVHEPMRVLHPSSAGAASRS